MCPACVASAAAWVVGGTMSTGGLAAITVRVLGRKKQQTIINTMSVSEDHVHSGESESNKSKSEPEGKSASFDELLKAI